ncbi:MAG: hypothetical protein K2Y37_10075 [Pirellulales bacterium]|nr:hypothetical protein [Pirellulales bacterium]
MAAVAALVLGFVGCAPLRPLAKSPLLPAQMSPDSVVLDIVFVRLPPQEPAEVAELWAELDEQQLPASLRQRLARNGFRVGVAGGQLPQSLARLIDNAMPLGEDIVAASQPAPDSSATTVTVTDFQDQPALSRRHLQLRDGLEAEIVASGIYPSLPLLEADADRQLGGRRYNKAQGVISLKAFAEADGRVRLDLRPELQYGEPQQEIRPDAGRWLMQSRRRRHAIDDLQIEALLSPGEMLVLAAHADDTGSAGHYFFTESSGAGTTRKLLLIRLSQTQHEELFGTEELAAEIATAE